MAEKKTYAPFSQVAKSGTTSAPIDGYIRIPDSIQPIISAGRVGTDGEWIIQPTSDKEFIAMGKDEAIANGGEILAPQSVTGEPPWPLDMTGFTDLQIAIRPSNGGNYAIAAVMGPATFPYANLRDVNAGNDLKGISGSRYDNVLTTSFNDSVDSLTADVWNIFMIQLRLKNQKLLQFKIINNSGGESDIETAFMRLV